MKTKLIVAFRDGTFSEKIFNTREDALSAADTLERSLRAVGAQDMLPTIGFDAIIPGLNDWIPDEAEIELLRSSLFPYIDGRQVTGNRVAAVKYVRTRARTGLKEAKGWVDEHFPRSTPNSLGELLRAKLAV